MRKMTKIIVSDPDGKELARAEFRGDGILVLAAGSAGLAGDGMRLVLTESPDQDALAYAIFVLRRCVVYGVSARSDVSFPGGRRCRMGSDCDFYIGSARLRISVGHGLGRKRWIAAASVVVAIFFAAFVPLGLLNSERSSMDVGGDVPTAKAELEPTPEEDLAREVTAHMREGNADQARLAIIEHVERHGESESARTMLASIERAIRRDKPKSIDGVSTARMLYDEGLKMMRSGELEVALHHLNEANEALPSAHDDLPLRKLIEEARSEAAAGYKEGMRGMIDSLQGLLDREADPPGRTEILLKGLRDCDGIAKHLRDDEQMNTLRGRLRTALEDSAGRWLAATQAAELYSGCEGALGGYRRIASLLEEALPKVANEASRALDACEGGG